MENSKDVFPTFEKTLLYFYKELNRVEASFSSKLVATINPELPIWDAFVLNILNLKKPAYNSKDRVCKTIDMYEQISNWYKNFISREQGMQVIKLFDEKFPDTKISKVKKVDFVLWQIRE